MKNNSQKGSVIWWVIAAVVILASIWIVTAHKSSTHSTTPAATGVTLMVPADEKAYENAVANYVNTNGTQNLMPLQNIQFVSTTTIPQSVSSDMLQNIAESSAEFVHGQAPAPLIASVKVSGGVAHVEYTFTGWTGVSFYLAAIEPIIQKNLLAQPGITSVTFGNI